MLSVGWRWTQLCCELGKLLECVQSIVVELPLSDHVRGLDPSDGGAGRMASLEAHHRAGDPLYKSTILLKDSVQIFDLQDFDSLPCSGTF